MIRPIVIEGEAVLRETAKPWDDPVGPEARQHAQDLLDSFRAGPPAVGLASPQIGVGRRSFLLAVGTGTFGGPKGTLKQEHPLMGVFVNPQVLTVEGSCEFFEGCLSMPDVHAVVVRPAAVTVSAVVFPIDAGKLQDPVVVQDVRLDGMTARVFQHEYDHLDGRLFVDHLEGTDAVNARIDWKNSKKRIEKKLAKKAKRAA